MSKHRGQNLQSESLPPGVFNQKKTASRKRDIKIEVEIKKSQEEGAFANRAPSSIKTVVPKRK